MQEVFEYLAMQFSEGHPALTKLIDQYCHEKKEKLVQSLEEKYTDNLYDAIGYDNPLER